MRDNINEKIEDQIEHIEKSLQPIILSFSAATYEK